MSLLYIVNNLNVRTIYKNNYSIAIEQCILSKLVDVQIDFDN